MQPLRIVRKPPPSLPVRRPPPPQAVIPGAHRRVLWAGLSLSLRRGESLLIVGPSGCGKTMLLRAIAGLWRSGSGAVRTAPQRQLFFLPQARKPPRL